MYLIQFRHGDGRYRAVTYYPHAGAARADEPRDACHYATREMAEQVIKNLEDGGMDVTHARVINDPLPVNERIGIAMRRQDSRWNY